MCILTETLSRHSLHGMHAAALRATHIESSVLLQVLVDQQLRRAVCSFVPVCLLGHHLDGWSAVTTPLFRCQW